MRLHGLILTLVVALGGDVDAVTVGTIALPSPHILLSVLLPQPVTLHGSVLEVAHVVLLREGEQAAAVGFVIDEVAEVGGAGGEAHEALPHAAVQAEAALVERVSGHQHAQSVPAPPFHSPEVDPVLAAHHLVPLLS
jgi:hypothetical protein